MTELRRQFEALPEIKRIVSCDEIKWCNVYNWYRTDNTDANSIYHVAWLNGAWWAFQEQQKKIDEALKILEGMRHNGAYRAIDALKGIKK